MSKIQLKANQKSIKSETAISGKTTVEDWKKIRLNLIKVTNSEIYDRDEWECAFSLLDTRIKTRFLNPINWILEKGVNEGEGFSVVALQCILIEFLESLYQVKVYTTSEKPREFEYKFSKELFRDFLMKHKPFSDYFKDEKNANGFYDNIRCGLLHEAATKQTSRIKHNPNGQKIVEFIPVDPTNMLIFREHFYKGILEFIVSYKSELLENKKLQTNFIRKFDDLCGIKHEYYFAYGSNMLLSQLEERIGKYHAARPVKLSDYKFVYNKKSEDGSAKANIKKSSGDVVYGICYEIDDEDLKELAKKEKGYNLVKNISTDNKLQTVTFISESIDNSLIPSNDYKNKIIEGAKFWQLDQKYIDENLL